MKVPDQRIAKLLRDADAEDLLVIEIAIRLMAIMDTDPRFRFDDGGKR